MALFLLLGTAAADCQYYQQLTHGPWRAVIDASGGEGCSLQDMYIAMGTREQKLGEQTLKAEPISEAWLKDLDRNQKPELIVVTNSAGSGSYGRLRIFTPADDQGLQIVEPPVLNECLNGEYRGHDLFRIQDGVIVHEFPIYRKEDPNCCPSGGLRRLFYRFTGTDLVLIP
jgi:hypothetical protein